MQKLKSTIRRNPTLSKYYTAIYDLRKLLKKLIADGVYMDFKYVVLDEKKVAYIVLQKVASTTIRVSMLGMEDEGLNHVEMHKKIRKSKYSVTSLDPATYQGYYVFTFVRNPFERMVSCYENMYHTHKAFTSNGFFDRYLLGYIRKDKGFKHFARRACGIPDRLCDPHFVSQSFAIDRMGQNPKPDFIGHFEKLAEEYQPICERFNFMPLPHYNKTVKQSSWMDYYDIPTAKRVYKRYRKDIELYGYQDTYEQLMEHLMNRK